MGSFGGDFSFPSLRIIKVVFGLVVSDPSPGGYAYLAAGGC